MTFLKTYISTLFLMMLPCSLFAQEIRFQTIEKDPSFEPYVRYDSLSGNYYFGYMKDKETGEVYETLYIPPTKVDPILDVQIEKGAGGYRYLYTLKNGSESKQDISSLELEIKDQFKNIELIDPWYFRENRALPFIRITHKVYNVPEYEEGKPIKFETDLQIGEILEFEVNSSNPSSIVTSFISGQPKQLDLSFVIPPSFEVRQMVDSLRENVINDRGLELKTIGPRALPENISNTALADTLQSYLTFSCDTTWIENSGICRSLEAKLDNVEKQLERGNSNAASGSLQAFLNEVDAQKDKQLSSEAWALLYFNGQYLLERLN